MKISLRKAKALQTSITEAMKNIKLNVNVDINEFQDAVAEVNSANAVFVTESSRYLNLLSALYSIRGAVGKENSESGIDLLLTAEALVSKTLEFQELFVGAPTQWDASVLTGKVAKLKNPTNEYRSDDYISAPILTAAQLNTVKISILELKKKRQNLANSILEANIKSTITISDEVMLVLRTESLI